MIRGMVKAWGQIKGYGAGAPAQGGSEQADAVSLAPYSVCRL